MSSSIASVITTERLLPSTLLKTKKIAPLSLVDATTANFALTNSVWLFEKPTRLENNGIGLVDHLRQSLQATLVAYPQWCGQLKSITTLDGTTDEEAQHLPRHARRYGRIYACYGTEQDPGIEFVTAKSSMTLEEVCPASRTSELPLWDQKNVPLHDFIAPTTIASALKPNNPDELGTRKVLMAVQVTELACGGFALAAKVAHPLADITALITFVKDWARISRAAVAGESEPQLDTVFEPWRVDSLAAGDIDADEPDETLVEKAKRLPMHRYDWWAPSPGSQQPPNVPDVFKNQDIPAAGKAMPWSDWDVQAPVSTYILHLSKAQVEFLWTRATSESSLRVSRHDAILAHVWSCIMRARRLQQDDGPVHCDLVIGLRPALNLGEAFLGSTVIMVNIEMPGRDAAAISEHGPDPKTVEMGPIVRKIRETITAVNQPAELATHIYGIAYEKSPQRIWQAFLGRRHILVTTWARAGLYGVDFGLGSTIRYADGVVPLLDGDVLIKEAPGPISSSWTDNGVDVSINICQEDMDRLLEDPILLPRLG